MMWTLRKGEGRMVLKWRKWSLKVHGFYKLQCQCDQDQEKWLSDFSLLLSFLMLRNQDELKLSVVHLKTVMPKGRIINSCAVDYWTVCIHIMGTMISFVRLTTFRTLKLYLPVPVQWWSQSLWMLWEFSRWYMVTPRANLGTCHQLGLNSQPASPNCWLCKHVQNVCLKQFRQKAE